MNVKQSFQAISDQESLILNWGAKQARTPCKHGSPSKLQCQFVPCAPIQYATRKGQ